MKNSHRDTEISKGLERDEQLSGYAFALIGGLTMTTTERLARFEAAQEVLGFLMAVRAEWIYIESKKAQPDASKIAQWEAEQKAFFEIEDGLRFDDQDGIEQVITTYGPVARRIFEAR